MSFAHTYFLCPHRHILWSDSKVCTYPQYTLFFVYSIVFSTCGFTASLLIFLCAIFLFLHFAALGLYCIVSKYFFNFLYSCYHTVDTICISNLRSIRIFYKIFDSFPEYNFKNSNDPNRDQIPFFRLFSLFFHVLNEFLMLFQLFFEFSALSVGSVSFR